MEIEQRASSWADAGKCNGSERQTIAESAALKELKRLENGHNILLHQFTKSPKSLQDFTVQLNQEWREEQRPRNRQQWSQARWPDQCLSQEQQRIPYPHPLRQNQQRSQEIWLDQWRWLNQNQWSSQGLQMGHDQQMSQEEQLSRQENTIGPERPLSQEQQLSLEQQLHQEQRPRQHPQLGQALSMMMSQEFRTFDDAANIFTSEEWNEWKEVEQLLSKPVMKTHSVHHVVQDAGQTDETNLVECSDSGGGENSGTSCRVRSLIILNSKHKVKYPEKQGSKRSRYKKQSIKARLKKLRYTNRKTLSIVHGSPEKPPTLHVQTGNEADASLGSTRDLAGVGEQNSFKKPTICYDCGKLFFCQARLFRHQEMHRALKPYECSECGEPFFSQSLLLRHQVIHPGLQSYNCTECGKNFISLELLLTHQEMHSWQKRYNCTDMGKRFLSQDLYHALRPYYCTECGKSFETELRFRHHQSTHTWSKAFECSECEIRFNQIGLFMWHCRTHTGKKPALDTVSAANEDFGLNPVPEKDALKC